MNNRTYICIIVLAAIVSYFLSLGNLDIAGRDETRRALVVKTMVETGDYVIPRQSENGKPYMSKPPQYYWHAVMLSELVGFVNEWTLRLPSAIAALIATLLLYLLTRSLTGNNEVAFTAALLLMLSPLFIKHARMATLDMTLVMFEMAALTGFYFGYCQERFRQVYYFLGFVALGFAFVTKGPVGIITPSVAVLCFLTVLCCLCEEKSWKKFFSPHSIWHILVLLLVAIPWYIIAYGRLQDMGMDPIAMFYHETATVATNTYAHKQPFYYFIYQYPLGAFPWSLIFIGGLFFHRSIAAPFKQAKIFALCCFVPNFILFSIFSSKQSYYLLPLYPAGCLYAALLLHHFFQARPKLQKAIVPCLAVLFFSIALVMNVSSNVYSEKSSVKPLVKSLADNAPTNKIVYCFDTKLQNLTFYAAVKFRNIRIKSDEEIDKSFLKKYGEDKITDPKVQGKLEEIKSRISIKELLASNEDFLIMTPRQHYEGFPTGNLVIVEEFKQIRLGNSYAKRSDIVLLKRYVKEESADDAD